jgi:proton-translocating NADH-quinone oxidoreductase chain L
MLLLVAAENFVSLFVGWEGVGLCSYLLISFWYTRIQASKAAIKAMVVNRIADLALTVGIVTALYLFQSFNFSTAFGLVTYLGNSEWVFFGALVDPVVVLTLCLFLGAVGKSAQIGLHTWLPDAMEGPTPVSALIHAATMVTAGVVLIIRCATLFECAPKTLLVVTVVGASTAFMAATAGLVQNDLKRVIAYSTCSQLGYMVFVCGLSQYSMSFFHLANHAFFKALLFLSAGAVIHSVSNEQDLRRFGGLSATLPYAYSMFFIGSMVIIGFPFLSGFYSKEAIIESAGALDITGYGEYAQGLGLITALFTTFYSFRLFALTFFGETRADTGYASSAHESPKYMAVCLAILAVGSVFFGYVAKDVFIGLGSSFWDGSVGVSQKALKTQLSAEFELTLEVKEAPLRGAATAVYLVTLWYAWVGSHSWRAFLDESVIVVPQLGGAEAPIWAPVYRFLVSKWYFDAVYNLFINQPLLSASYHAVFALIDKGVLEHFGPTGFGALTFRAGGFVTRLQTGYLPTYGQVFLAGAALSVLGVFADASLMTGDTWADAARLAKDLQSLQQAADSFELPAPVLLLTGIFFKPRRFHVLTKRFALLRYTPFRRPRDFGVFIFFVLIVLNWGYLLAVFWELYGTGSSPLDRGAKIALRLHMLVPPPAVGSLPRNLEFTLYGVVFTVCWVFLSEVFTSMNMAASPLSALVSGLLLHAAFEIYEMVDFSGWAGAFVVSSQHVWVQLWGVGWQAVCGVTGLANFDHWLDSQIEAALTRQKMTYAALEILGCPFVVTLSWLLLIVVTGFLLLFFWCGLQSLWKHRPKFFLLVDDRHIPPCFTWYQLRPLSNHASTFFPLIGSELPPGFVWIADPSLQLFKPAFRAAVRAAYARKDWAALINLPREYCRIRRPDSFPAVLIGLPVGQTDTN